MKKKHNQLKVIKNKKRGVAVAEAILLIGISLVIVMTLFYPQISNMMSEALMRVTNWFNNAITNLGI